jgi:hypothetical protein
LRAQLRRDKLSVRSRDLQQAAPDLNTTKLRWNNDMVTEPEAEGLRAPLGRARSSQTLRRRGGAADLIVRNNRSRTSAAGWQRPPGRSRFTLAPDADEVRDVLGIADLANSARPLQRNTELRETLSDERYG